MEDKQKKPIHKRWCLIVIVVLATFVVIGVVTIFNSSNDNTKNSVKLHAGEYIVGEDIEAGRYDVTCTSGLGSFYVYEEDRIIVSELLYSSNKASKIDVTKIQYDLYDGQKIVISDTNDIVLTPSTIKLRKILYTGMHIVGRDVAEGRHTIKVPEGSGMLVVNSVYGEPEIIEFLGKDENGVAVEIINLTLKEGETIFLSGVKLIEIKK